jgi:signal peptidase II
VKPVFWLLIFSLVVFDQFAKIFAVQYFRTTCNSGFAFGFSPDWFGLFIPIFVLFLVLVLFWFEKSRHNLFAFSLIFAGGFSNLLDRLWQGCVVDFIDLGFWPAFNVADAVISSGVVILAVGLIKNRIRK